MKIVLIFSTLFFLLIFLIILLIKNIIKLIKNKNLPKQNIQGSSLNKNQTLNAYRLYFNWCENNNLIPVPEVKFNSLANEKGSINITDMIALHPEYHITNKTNDNYETEKLKENEKQKKGNQDFVNSAVIGYMTDSTTAGTLLGGSLLGGMLGSHLSKKKRK